VWLEGRAPGKPGFKHGDFRHTQLFGSEIDFPDGESIPERMNELSFALREQAVLLLVVGNVPCHNNCEDRAQ